MQQLIGEVQADLGKPDVHPLEANAHEPAVRGDGKGWDGMKWDGMGWEETI